MQCGQRLVVGDVESVDDDDASAATFGDNDLIIIGCGESILRGLGSPVSGREVVGCCKNGLFSSMTDLVGDGSDTFPAGFLATG